MNRTRTKSTICTTP